MKISYSSFFVKLSGLYLLLLLIGGIAYSVLSVRSSIDFVKAADQRMNIHLAESVAGEAAPLVRDSIHTQAMGQLLHYLMVMNPHIEIYILDSTGAILAFFADKSKTLQRNRVSLEPILGFLNDPNSTTTRGDDPRSLGRTKPFTAAPLTLYDSTRGYVYVILGGEQYDLAEASIRKQFLASSLTSGLVVALLLTFLLGLIAFFLMTRRLNAMTAAVGEFAGGRLARRVNDVSADEFGKLAAAFNQMANTIECNVADLKRSDELRRELVANISHDLRTPLASIQGYLETIVMKGDDLLSEDAKRYAQISLQNCKYLNQLVSELFELSKLNAIHARPNEEPFSILELTQDVLLKFKSPAEAKAVELRCSFEQRVPLVLGDVGMIERALSNLIDNAVRYTPQGARVSVEFAPSESHVRIEIRDSGPGISPEDLPNIFLPYYRGKKGPAKEVNGTGLGLAITKRILELHHSEIRVATELARGTNFSFDLVRA